MQLFSRSSQRTSLSAINSELEGLRPIRRVILRFIIIRIQHLTDGTTQNLNVHSFHLLHWKVLAARCRWDNGPISELPTETELMARACHYHCPEICYEFDMQKTEYSTMIPEGG